MKLKDEDIKKIAKMVDNGESVSTIARKFSYNYKTMFKLIGRYKLHGIQGILHNKNKIFSIEEKIKIINRHYSGESVCSLATEINVRDSLIQSWIKKYEQLGYNGLIDNRGRPGVAKMGRPKKNQEHVSTTETMAPVTDAEREELNKLRKENYQLKMENACLKKIQALVQQRQNRQMKKK